MDIKPRPDMPRPNTVWETVTDLDHDYREETNSDGSKTTVHAYDCRRCRLELLLREATNRLGTPPD